MKTLTVKHDLFPALHAYHVYATLAFATIPAALASVSGDGIRKTTLNEQWITPSICRKEEIWSLEFLPVTPEGNPAVNITAFYAKDGGYVGDEQTVNTLLSRGIEPQRKSFDVKVCSIGFSEREKKWFGWSHRGMCGFGIGDVYYGAGQMWGYYEKDPSILIKNMDEAKQCAINYADDMS